MLARWSRLAIAALAIAVLAGCVASSSSPAPTQIAQQRYCGRLSDASCAQAITAVQAQVPETRGSQVAVADYSTAGASATQGAGGTGTYLVAFAPLPGEDVWMDPPTWFVSHSATGWTLNPATDLAGLNVCFILLLDQAGLASYAPTFPSGVCG